jgi:diguanylate cyclase (GGDEF)-like protein
MADPRSGLTEPQRAQVTAAGGYEPYGQLVKMLLPSTRSVAIYDGETTLAWCSEGYERPDLRAMLEQFRATQNDALAKSSIVKHAAAGEHAFIAALRGTDGNVLGYFVLELDEGQSARYSDSIAASLLKPVLDCLENRMSLERSLSCAEGDERDDLELLLGVDSEDREDATALEQLLRHCVEHLGCALGALLIPDKNLSVSCSTDASVKRTDVLDRTQKHLLAWAQLNNRPMVVNRVGAGMNAAPYKILSCPVRDPYNRVTGLLALFRTAASEDFEVRDVRILEFVSRKAVGILENQYDALTGLINRRSFERRVQNVLDDSDRATHSLLYVDIDKLETLNESFGLHAGDEVIQRVADVIRNAVTADDFASRIGGDRFAVFLARRDAAQAVETAKGIHAALSQLGYMNGEHSLPVSASIGVARAHETRTSAAHLTASAELACKRAKSQGRNGLEVQAENPGLLLASRVQMFASANLQAALKNNRFQLETQPIIGLHRRRGETVGYEILVRMRSPTGELLAPDKFFDAAERYELMPALDRWVVCSTIELLREQASSLADLPYCFTVNVSAQSLATGKFASFALGELAHANLPPAAFCFELKEAVAVTQLEKAEALIREIVAAGAKIALDDFGHGLSSLANLKRLPVQFLKIDGRFVRRILEDRIAESIVSGIARAANTLGVRTIAEHVESKALADKLHALEVDYAQGFFFGRAQPFAKPAADSADRAAGNAPR